MSRTGRSHAPVALGVPGGLPLASALCESASTWLVLAALVPVQMQSKAVTSVHVLWQVGGVRCRSELISVVSVIEGQRMAGSGSASASASSLAHDRRQRSPQMSAAG